MRKARMFVSFTAVAMLAAPATAQVVGMGTTQAGATAQLSTVVAKVLTDKGGLQVRPQPMAGVVQYAPLVNDGEIEFGVSNIVEYAYLVEGKALVDKPNPQLRLVARLVPWYNGLVVKADSPIKSVRDLKGQPTPAGFTGNPLGRVLMDGYLANAQLQSADTRQVLVPAFPRMFELFKQGQIATAISTIGSPVLKEWEAAVGPVRFLSFDDSPAAVAALVRHIRGAEIVDIKPAPGRTGVPAPTKLVNYDYVLFASVKTRDEVVAKAVDALYANPAELKASGPIWEEFDPGAMAKDLGLAYHAGAVKAFQAKGLWKR